MSGYDGRALDLWAARIAAWRDGGRDVYVFFDNDVKARAPFDAMNLASRLGHGARVSFPHTALRASEAKRGVEETGTTWNRRGGSGDR